MPASRFTSRARSTTTGSTPCALVGAGRTAALVGSSGAGKSTLVNALLREDRMRTGATRADDGRGRHVTTHRQFALLPAGGLLLDTPGMRELQIAGEEGLDLVFDDVAALAERCRYSDGVARLREWKGGKP